MKRKTTDSVLDAEEAKRQKMEEIKEAKETKETRKISISVKDHTTLIMLATSSGGINFDDVFSTMDEPDKVFQEIDWEQKIPFGPMKGRPLVVVAAFNAAHRNSFFLLDKFLNSSSDVLQKTNWNNLISDETQPEPQPEQTLALLACVLAGHNNPGMLQTILNLPFPILKKITWAHAGRMGLSYYLLHLIPSKLSPVYLNTILHSELIFYFDWKNDPSLRAEFLRVFSDEACFPECLTALAKLPTVSLEGLLDYCNQSAPPSISVFQRYLRILIDLKSDKEPSPETTEFIEDSPLNASICYFSIAESTPAMALKYYRRVDSQSVYYSQTQYALVDLVLSSELKLNSDESKTTYTLFKPHPVRSEQTLSLESGCEDSSSQTLEYEDSLRFKALIHLCQGFYYDKNKPVDKRRLIISSLGKIVLDLFSNSTIPTEWAKKIDDFPETLLTFEGFDIKNNVQIFLEGIIEYNLKKIEQELETKGGLNYD